MTHHCTCCDRDVEEGEWDGLYTSCGRCAFEASLEHFPCDHGAEWQAKQRAAHCSGEATRVGRHGCAWCDALFPESGPVTLCRYHYNELDKDRRESASIPRGDSAGPGHREVEPCESSAGTSISAASATSDSSASASATPASETSTSASSSAGSPSASGSSTKTGVASVGLANTQAASPNASDPRCVACGEPGFHTLRCVPETPTPGAAPPGHLIGCFLCGARGVQFSGGPECKACGGAGEVFRATPSSGPDPGETADLETVSKVYRNGVRDGRRETIAECAKTAETLSATHEALAKAASKSGNGKQALYDNGLADGAANLANLFRATQKGGAT